MTLELCCIFLSMCCITGDLLKFICPQDQGLLGKMHHHLESQSEMTQQKQEQILMWSISWLFISLQLPVYPEPIRFSKTNYLVYCFMSLSTDNLF